MIRKNYISLRPFLQRRKTYHALILCIIWACYFSTPSLAQNQDPLQPILLSEDGSWCWFQDKRALLLDDKVIFTGVTSEGFNTVSEWDLSDNETYTKVLTKGSLPADDHNVGALMLRPDGKLLTVYAGHSIDSLVRYRSTRTGAEIRDWEEESVVKTNGRVCYSNLFHLKSTGETFNFFRGNGNNPHYLLSEDDGESWRFGGRLFQFEGRSYLKYASDGAQRIHFITTDGHPRYFNNNIYHGYIENGKAYRSDGSLVGPLSTTDTSNLRPADFTLVYDGDLETRTDVAWTSDMQLDESGLPYFVYSVTKDPISRGETIQTSLGGMDHRYHYARWTGREWLTNEIAYAGSRLYPGENEYTGLISLHPHDKNILYFSADVHPATGDPLLVNGERRYEIFRAERRDEESEWQFSPVTFQSEEDNIRPLVLADQEKEIVLWLSGRYSSYRDYKLKVFGKVLPKRKNNRAESDKKITFLISVDPDNYAADMTIPYFAMKLAKEKGYETQVITGEGEKNAFLLPGLDSVTNSDLLVLFLRRVALSKTQMAYIKNHIKEGKPILGIRTANHAFSVREEPIPDGFEDWWEFVPDVLGHENQGYGPARDSTSIIPVKKPGRGLLKGIPDQPWTSQGNLYLMGNSLDPDARVLLRGNSASHEAPIAYTRKSGKSKVFYTSLGYPTDFTHASFLQLLENAIAWTLK
ncbi:Type 1 glutamine amidotransferase (GATase1) [Cyclobacterium lianum]|uniref:Type 1 glutamine amidotransferase (GATase1) n=1 Tax=Cyclobacterium lianum TaxID=388280 RepID=A0A1M7P868_9BACT|nr:BNR-4 repeat-containing protein [Cyclobacterium lianum]SHN12825.1 Type 1 glutamine amidotransferase (GATase1) [Cyclobacterium lianum]